MSISRSLVIVFLVLQLVQVGYAQRKNKERKNIERSPRQELVYDNFNYLESIKTVQVYPTGQENFLPVYTLGSDQLLEVSFDDLRADIRSFYYNLEHCNADWTPSRVSILDYAEGYNEDRIVNHEPSQGTLQPYTHYSFTFPNTYVRPKIAGNYLLKVYEDADQARLLFTRKIYVVRPLVQVDAEITNSAFADKRRSHQKLNVYLKSGLTIANPHRDIQIHVLQNQRADNKVILQKPMYIGPSEIKYNLSETLDFAAGNEFRFVDLRSIKGGSAQTQAIQVDTSVQITIFPDEVKTNSAYASLYDENGRFYIRNLDYDYANTNSEYADVHFALAASEQIKGDIYIVGGFNDFKRTTHNKLTYNPVSKLWEVKLKLKQGLYDYEYILVDEQKQVQPTALSGSHWDTGNDYQILVYYRRAGTYWDEILGFKTISINNKENKN